MPYKDADKNRAYQREWRKQKLAKMKVEDPEKYQELQERIKIYKRNYRRSKGGQQTAKSYREQAHVRAKRRIREDKYRYGELAEVLPILRKLEKESYHAKKKSD
jgi:hypothetical protein